MDVSPPPYADFARRTCSGNSTRCAGGDRACREAAQKAGYVFCDNYNACEPGGLRLVPGFTGYLVLGSLALGLVLGGAGVMVWFRRRAKHAR